MKKLVYAACAAGLSAGAIMQAHGEALRLESWKAVSVPVRAPYMNDSINPHDVRFKNADLLGSRFSANLKNLELVTADTAGFMAVPAAADRAMLTSLQTSVRARRFAKGEIKVTSPVAFSLLVDGEKSIDKDSVEDSVGDASSRTASVRLEPERDVILTLRVLSTPTDSVAPVVKVEYIPDDGFDSIALYNGADLKRRLRLTDTQYSNRVGGVRLSHDGRYLLMRQTNSYDEENFRVRTTVTDLNTGRVINSNVPWASEWMPGSNTLYYTEKHGTGYDLFTLDPVTGKETVLAEDIPESGFTWAPDASFLLYTVTDKGIEESGPLRRYATPDDRQPGNRARYNIVRYTPATGVSEVVTYGNHSAILSDISPDGRRILVTTARETPTVRPFYSGCVYELDLETLQADTIVPYGPQFASQGIYSPDGKQVLLTGSPAAFDNLGKNCGDHPIPNDFDMQLYLYNLADKTVKPLSKDFDPSVVDAVWSKADGNIYLVVEEGFDKPLYRLNPHDGKYTRLPLEVPYVSTWTLPADKGDRLVYTGSDFTYSGKCWMLDMRSGKNRLLADPDSERMAEIELGEVQPWNFTSSRGDVIEGYAVYPPGFEPDRKYPLIVYYYGGTSPTAKTFLQPYTPQLFASRDYIVYVLNPSGATGYGQEFSARHVNAWGDYTAQDIIEGVKKFVEAHPAVNPDRVGCLGASYGGFMTQYLQTLTPMFAAAVSHAGISNVASYWGEGYWGYSYNSVAAADSYPWTNPDLYTRHGSLFNADKIDTPLLLLHGTADTNVPIGESIQLFNALRVLGKEVEFISVDGENHFIMDMDKRQSWHNSIMAFFAKYLQDDPRYWNDLWPERKL